MNRFCRLPWIALDIGADGKAHPCCRTHAIDLGTEDPWMHPEMMELRHQLATDELDAERFPDCAKCPMRYTEWE